MPETLRNKLLTPEGMDFLRTTATSHYRWFIHEAPFALIDNIRAEGLQPINPGRHVPDRVLAEVGGDPDIVCEPFGKHKSALFEPRDRAPVRRRPG